MDNKVRSSLFWGCYCLFYHVCGSFFLSTDLQGFVKMTTLLVSFFQSWTDVPAIFEAALWAVGHSCLGTAKFVLSLIVILFNLSSSVFLEMNYFWVLCEVLPFFHQHRICQHCKTKHWESTEVYRVGSLIWKPSEELLKIFVE